MKIAQRFSAGINSNQTNKVRQDGGNFLSSLSGDWREFVYCVPSLEKLGYFQQQLKIIARKNWKSLRLSLMCAERQPRER